MVAIDMNMKTEKARLRTSGVMDESETRMTDGRRAVPTNIGSWRNAPAHEEDPGEHEHGCVWVRVGVRNTDDGGQETHVAQAYL